MVSALLRLPLLAAWRREFADYDWTIFRRDLLAGLTVGAVALPLALAFGVASGANAAAGLVTAILAGVVIAGLGGAAYQISGPTGAMSAVLIVLAQRYGLAGVWVAGLMAGIFLLLLGLFRLGRYIAFIPSPVITGFTSGIALIIAIGQIDNFLGVTTPNAENNLSKLLGYFTHPIAPDWHAVALALIVMLVMIVLPRRLDRWLASRSPAWWQCWLAGRYPRSVPSRAPFSSNSGLPGRAFRGPRCLICCRPRSRSPRWAESRACCAARSARQ
jgi:sulfate permease, SulP family